MLPYITPAQAKQIASQGGGSTPGASNVLIYNSEITWATGTDIIVLNDLNLTEAECIAALDSGKAIIVNLKIKDFILGESGLTVDARASYSVFKDSVIGSLPSLFPALASNVYDEYVPYLIYFMRTLDDQKTYWRNGGQSEEWIATNSSAYAEILEEYECSGKWIMLLE